jgi:hypothetical protein
VTLVIDGAVIGFPHSALKKHSGQIDIAGSSSHQQGESVKINSRQNVGKSLADRSDNDPPGAVNLRVYRAEKCEKSHAPFV